jgi:hypothetical protein
MKKVDKYAIISPKGRRENERIFSRNKRYASTMENRA